VRKVVFEEPVVQRLSELVPDRECLLSVYNRLRDQLENHADDYRYRRDPDDPDFLFDYLLVLHTPDGWLTLRFSVNDTQSPDHLFVEAVSANR
jgi:hypothetical protein